MAKWEERQQQASETFARFVPEAEPARVLASMERNMGALGTFAFTAVGEMWSRPILSRRDRSLMIIAVLAAQSRDEELVLHTGIGLRHGLTRTEIEEINLHVAAYVGFPAAMAASRRMDQAFCDAEGVEKISGRVGAEHLGDDERLERAAEVRATLTAGTASADRMAEIMASINRDLARDHTLEYAALLREVGEARGPVLIHCAAGKDRTGFGVAMRLSNATNSPA